MTTNFTQYNVLQILGEDQDMRTIKLYYLDDVLQNKYQVTNAAGMHNCYIGTASSTHVIGDKQHLVRYWNL